MEDALQVHPPGYLTDQDWSHPLGTQLLVDTQEVDLYHLLLSEEEGKNPGTGLLTGKAILSSTWSALQRPGPSAQACVLPLPALSGRDSDALPLPCSAAPGKGPTLYGLYLQR